ncbi:hypothetical protein [Arenimonas alkanexedens]
MKRMMTAVLLLLVACQPQPVDPAFDETAGAELLVAYEAARTAGDFEIAEARGDELRQRHGETQAATTMRSTLGEVRVQAEQMRERRRLIGLWEYQSIPAAGGIQHTAALYSRVETYSGEVAAASPDARLILRRHPEWGESAYLVLNQQKLGCGPPCVIQIRFDEGEPERFTGDPADTGTGPAVFIEERDRFLAAMTQATRVRIELPRSGHLVPAFEFEVAGFLPARHLAE